LEKVAEDFYMFIKEGLLSTRIVLKKKVNKKGKKKG
jgi:hypothetical protein